MAVTSESKLSELQQHVVMFEYMDFELPSYMIERIKQVAADTAKANEETAAKENGYASVDEFRKSRNVVDILGVPMHVMSGEPPGYATTCRILEVDVKRVLMDWYRLPGRRYACVHPEFVHELCGLVREFAGIEVAHEFVKDNRCVLVFGKFISPEWEAKSKSSLVAPFIQARRVALTQEASRMQDSVKYAAAHLERLRADEAVLASHLAQVDQIAKDLVHGPRHEVVAEVAPVHVPDTQPQPMDA